MEVQDLATQFTLIADKEKAVRMSAYMKNRFEFFGIQTPERRKVVSTVFKEWEVGKKPIDWKFVFDLWKQSEREYQYVAVDYLIKSKKYLSADDLTQVKELIISKSWWDTVDAIASGVVGYIVRTFPEQVKMMDDWIEDDNMWVKRTALLHQLSFKENTDEERLFYYCEKHASDKEFFIAKAIGWALREYGKTKPQSVITFVEKTPLQNLSKREALKHLK
ncbi:DNA alkylation repair protein [Evansella cellulosilytica]|uniref:DNA alkylation repair enzyme n=1 Tax=Evansella cellulosilytica (strain ATCC 21833 / DSM 2522 / FERM P-1141 / JCM 9156 / N-4) TaxID=649639 RepID=E6TRW7_EVAC2|nr:DNA alkylation repair protein [Evansella cellulosilytica]ADU29490.1 DNA alkylation repair enzyme [Evansella cellulosilytica DSM 2522]